MSETDAANNLTTPFISVPICVIRGKKNNRGWTLINADKKEMNQTTDYTNFTDTKEGGLEYYGKRCTTKARRCERRFSVAPW